MFKQYEALLPIGRVACSNHLQSLGVETPALLLSVRRKFIFIKVGLSDAIPGQCLEPFFSCLLMILLV
ncbi:hypothetical protein FGO68_gene15871 [Halteria grandinella]|uniref:Uncharacterized protein n=1 Tax=Halteria grandinella TaxID=5974 RepID=A0A8J8P8Y4_HALGN|nr:hypothetical protein FGO68_gene15871 [Halteria grandinella]